MEFRIVDTITDGFARLSGDEQKAVKTTASDLQLNPANLDSYSTPKRQSAGACKDKENVESIVKHLTNFAI